MTTRENILFLWLCMAMTAPLRAGTLLEARLQSLQYKDAWVDLRLSVGQDLARVDVKGPWTHGSLLYRRDNSLVTVVDHIHRTVLAVPPGSQEAIRLLGGLAAAKWKAEKEGGDGGPGDVYRLIHENVGSLFNGTPRLKKKDVRLDGFDCDDYVTDGEKGEAREVWVTTSGRIGMATEDYNTLRSLVHLAVDLASGELAPWGADTAAFQRRLAGSALPVRAVYYAGGKPSARFRMLSVRSESFPAGTFDPPAGYRTLGFWDLLRQGGASDP